MFSYPFKGMNSFLKIIHKRKKLAGKTQGCKTIFRMGNDKEKGTYCTA